MDGREYNDRGVIQAAHLEPVNCPLGPVEGTGTKEGCQDYVVCGDEYTVDNDEASLSFANQSDHVHSLMEEDESILVCLASEGLKACNNGVHLGPVTINSEALADTTETVKSAQSLTKMSTSEKYTSPLRSVPSCDLMVGSELAPRASALTRHLDPETADKHVITEVHMADLDYLAEEFIKLRTAQKEQRERKEKMKRSGCKLSEECGCIQRAQQAELGLLALQYSVCRQHCWRLYYTSAEGEQLTALRGDMDQYWPKDPPANILSVLQKLESDYNQMRDEILEGVPLEQLKPLSVDSEKIIIGASYIPAQITGGVQGNLPSWCSLEPEECPTSGEESGCPGDPNSNGCQDSRRLEKQDKMENSNSRRAVSGVPQDRGANCDAHKPEDKQTSAARKELSTSEEWYDAEEDLEPAGPAVTAETGQDPTVISESASEEAKSSVLCVSNLPSNVTKSDVMLWLEKYQASDVSISVLKNDLRVAIAMVGGPQYAEAAARELSGFSVEGHTLNVEHIGGAVVGGRGRGQTSASISEAESSRDATKPQPPKTDPSGTERKSMSRPPRSSSIKNRKVVCISPTAKGTCVPQHYGTMGSFDTLMAELTQRHPGVGRKRIVDALSELRAKHRGVLSGLPLRTIGEMASELLTRPASATQS